MHSQVVRRIFVALLAVSLSACGAITNMPIWGSAIGDLFPPKGRYDPLVKVPIVLDDPDSPTDFSFTPPYRGSYVIVIGSDSETFRQDWADLFIGKDPPFDLALRVNLLQNGVCVFTKQSRAPDFGLHDAGPESLGFSFAVFHCQSDTKYGKPVQATVEVLVPDRKLEEKYGPFFVVVRKTTDL